MKRSRRLNSRSTTYPVVSRELNNTLRKNNRSNCYWKVTFGNNVIRLLHKTKPNLLRIIIPFKRRTDINYEGSQHVAITTEEIRAVRDRMRNNKYGTSCKEFSGVILLTAKAKSVKALNLMNWTFNAGYFADKWKCAVLLIWI